LGPAGFQSTDLLWWGQVNPMTWQPCKNSHSDRWIFPSGRGTEKVKFKRSKASKQSTTDITTPSGLFELHIDLALHYYHTVIASYYC
jgi:hypothetical protein